MATRKEISTRDRNLARQHTQPARWRTTPGGIFLLNVLLASPLEPDLVERIASIDERLRVIARPDLLGQPRYPGDHFPPIQRSPEQAAEWSHLLGQAEVMLDVDQPSAADIVQRARRLRWIQSSSSGIGEWVRRVGL